MHAKTCLSAIENDKKRVLLTSQNSLAFVEIAAQSPSIYGTYEVVRNLHEIIMMKHQKPSLIDAISQITVINSI